MRKFIFTLSVFSFLLCLNAQVRINEIVNMGTGNQHQSSSTDGVENRGPDGLNNVTNKSLWFQNPYLKPDLYDVVVLVENQTGTTLNTIDVNYSLDGGNTTYTQQISGLNIAANFSEYITVPNFVNLRNPGVTKLQLWTSMPNGIQDMFPDDDLQQFNLVVVAKSPKKQVLVEKFTSANDGTCALSNMYKKTIMTDYSPSVITLAYHIDDNLEAEEFNTLATNSATNWYLNSGNACFDHRKADAVSTTMSSGPFTWETRVVDRMDQVTSASVNAEYTLDAETRLLSIDVTSSFKSDDMGDLRVNCILKEMNVSGLPQANDYNEDVSMIDMGLYQAGNPIVKYEHQDVVRKMLGGAFGVEGVIPGNVAQGQSFTHTFNYVIPENYNIENLKAVLTITKHDVDNPIGDFFVVNVNQIDLEVDEQVVVSGIKDEILESLNAAKVFPNPVSSELTFEDTGLNIDKVELLDNLGKSVYLELEPRSNNIPVANLSNGFYQLILESDGVRVPKKVIVQR